MMIYFKSMKEFCFARNFSLQNVMSKCYLISSKYMALTQLVTLMMVTCLTMMTEYSMKLH